jgi:precorrin-6B methylase 2
VPDSPRPPSSTDVVRGAPSPDVSGPQPRTEHETAKLSDDVPSELARCLNEPGHTPPTRAIDRLLAALIDVSEEHAKVLERALARAGARVVPALLAQLPQRDPAARPRLLSLLVRLAGDVEHPALYPALSNALDEPLAQSRKLAARGLGKLRDNSAEQRLLEALGRAPTVEQKSIVDALGTLGGEASLAPLAALVSPDSDLERRRERARLMIERRLGRKAPGQLALDTPLPARWRVALSCRSGLGAVLADELRERWQPTVVGTKRVDVEHSGSLRELLAARTALDVALVVPLAPSPGHELAPELSIAEALARHDCIAALSAWTEGTPRFRVSWTSGGHRRALTWALAAALRARTSALVNDSRAARWTLRAPPDARGELLLVPRFDEDPRFAYRLADVPAASHPTIAAALARIAGVQRDEVVWDPFVGSGLELVERARLGPARELWGSDVDPRALAAARSNLDAAGLHQARLVEADALRFAPPAPSLILTNPPMGRRVARDGSIGDLLDRFVEHASRVLRPSGRLVWLSPLPRRTMGVARRLGLEVVLGPDVDLGGFSAQVQICTRSP